MSTALYTGCKTPPAVIATKAEGVIVNSVDVGMNTWKLYVTANISNGKVTQKQLDDVHAAYDTYYNAQLIAKAALETYIITGSTDMTAINTANASVAQAQVALLTLLNQYLVK